MPSYKTTFGSFLKGEDLHGKGNVRVVIEQVTLEEVNSDERGKEKKLVARFVGKDKALVINRTNAEALEQITGTDDYDRWAGAMVALYFDPSIKMGAKTVGGIRIRSAQQLAAPAAPPVQAPPPVHDAPPLTDDDIPF